MRNHRLFPLAAGLLLAVHAPMSQADTEPAKPGEQTRAWLDLQASGAQASPADRPMSGEVAERVYQRYLDSFTHPIPDRFRREAFTDDSE